MRQKLVFFLIAGLVVAGSGCASAPSEGRMPSQERDLYESKETLVVLDKSLAKRIYLIQESTERTPDGRLVVKTQIFNKNSKDARLQIQTVFKDMHNAATGDETNWELVIVPANAYYYYEARALNALADKYVVRVREAR